jgi:hypothetical protein
VHISKKLQNILISGVLLLAAFLVAGTLYVYFTDRTIKAAPEQLAVAPSYASLPPPTPPGLNAQEGVAVETLTSPVARGTEASINAETNAGSTCSIEVSYNGVRNTSTDLAPKVANSYGNVNWNWTIGGTAPVGNWPIKVMCTYNGRTGLVDDTIQITE